MGMSETYEIKTIGDFLKIPSDRISICLKEMAEHLPVVRANLEMLGIEPTGKEINVFTWVDDGKKDLTVSLNCGDESLVVKLSKDSEVG